MNNEDLQKLVERISITFFHKPFLHKAVFNPRLRTIGGRYMLMSHHIEINKKYYEQFGENEIIDIIKHELCHYHLHLEGKGYKHRDADFRRLMREVDAPRYCSSLVEKKPLKTYQCVNCRQMYYRKRAIDTKRYVCGKCRGKLKLMNG
ncbi:SprT family protein [Bacillaceae bacterium Marseille-Q3522]|nr:SprT family protein [Bacillaceae bacterium Marseille-Q3522]